MKHLPNWIVLVAVLFALAIGSAIVWKILNFDIGKIEIRDWVTFSSSKHEAQSLSDIYTIATLIFS
jgi:hypothetical protein